MRKFFKKVVAAIATTAMAAGLFAAVPATEAKAAEGSDNGSYYIVGSMNGWDTKTAIAMTKSGTVYTYTYNVKKDQKVEFKIIENQADKWDSVTYQHSNNGGNFNKPITGDGNVTIKFDTSKLSADKWWDASGAVEITGSAFSAPVTPPAEDYHVFGDKGLTGYNFGDDGMDKGEMTKDGNGVFSIEFTNIKKGTYKYTILQDPENKGWDFKYYGKETQDNGYGGKDAIVKVTEDGSKVKISINASADPKVVTVEVTSPSGAVTKEETVNDDSVKKAPPTQTTDNSSANKTSTPSKTADAAPIAALAFVLVAMAGIVVVTKKRTVSE